ncbi:MAG TPA: arsenosugar biosynthesis radical SAM (seleno)protein ArsS [Thermodesulfovibrionales bacterium]|jgi:radical SAM/Cys-rich protein|nr:arsenosugar biosynthesis radical SAM (seleno)protein ArsS [Thermodesulfovibrionales bacterium]
MNKKFKDRISDIHGGPLVSLDVKILQVNLGYFCNMTCKHCHVSAGSGRKEVMRRETLEEVIGVLGESDIETLDITGGAPEMNPHFLSLVEEARGIGRHVMVRTNLTIFFEKGMEQLPQFYSRNNVEVIASLPFYLENDVDRVRGKGTFRKCIEALKILNSLGYGVQGSEKKLHLVYNPSGAFLSPQQKTLEDDYKRELLRGFGITFDNLYTFSNVPIGRFRDYLVRSGNFERYMEKLVTAFNPETLDGLMCRHVVNVGWKGTLHDCDFNQMLGLGVHASCGQHITDFDYHRLVGRTINVGEHCYSCTAGQGST